MSPIFRSATRPGASSSMPSANRWLWSSCGCSLISVVESLVMDLKSAPYSGVVDCSVMPSSYPSSRTGHRRKLSRPVFHPTNAPRIRSAILVAPPQAQDRHRADWAALDSLGPPLWLASEASALVTAAGTCPRSHPRAPKRDLDAVGHYRANPGSRWADLNRRGLVSRD